MPIDYFINRKDPWNILVVDDSKLNRAIVKNTLSRLNMQVAEAVDGEEGLAMLASNSFDLVLVDLIMPRLDGFGFLEKFRDYVREKFIPVILMTGSDDLNSKIRGLSIGADDFLLKPLNEKELSTRVLSLLRLKSANSELYDKNMLIMKELASAKKLQEFIVPKDFSFISYPSITGRYLPIEDIGGDFFDCYRLPSPGGRESGGNPMVGVLIADVTGHGIPAALVMSMTKMIFSIYAPHYHSTSKLLGHVNGEMRGVLLDWQYITAFYLIYNPENGLLSFTSAGHVRPLYYRREKGRVLGLDTGGLFIGIADDVPYEERAIKVERGDRLFLYTDGITELKNSEGEFYGEQNLARFITGSNGVSGEDFCEKLLGALNEFSPLKSRSDDIAFLNIEF